MGLTRLALTSWKSVRGQNVSQTSALCQGAFKEVKMGRSSIDTGILEVCKRLECVADQCFG